MAQTCILAVSNHVKAVCKMNIFEKNSPTETSHHALRSVYQHFFCVTNVQHLSVIWNRNPTAPKFNQIQNTRKSLNLPIETGRVPSLTSGNGEKRRFSANQDSFWCCWESGQKVLHGVKSNILAFLPCKSWYLTIFGVTSASFSVCRIPSKCVGCHWCCRV